MNSIRTMALLLCCGALAACNAGQSTPATQPFTCPSNASAAGGGIIVCGVQTVAIRLHVNGSLRYVRNVAHFTAHQIGYSGAFTYATSDANVIDLLSAPPPAVARRPREAKIVGSKGVWGYAGGAGRATITVVGKGGVNVSRTFLVVEPGPVDVDPAHLTFAGPSSGKPRYAALSQPKFNGAFKESDSCQGIASINARRNAGGRAVFAVKSEGLGKCEASFEGATVFTAGALTIYVLP